MKPLGGLHSAVNPATDPSVRYTEHEDGFDHGGTTLDAHR